MSKPPSTQATRFLKQHGVAYSEHLYPYVERGGTEASARALGVPEHAVVKTLVMEDEAGRPLIILMHGDREVSTKELARQIGAKSVQPCQPEIANKHSDYQIGGTSPFGTRKALPIYAEVTLFTLERIWINGGSRGFLVGLAPAALAATLAPVQVKVAVG